MYELMLYCGQKRLLNALNVNVILFADVDVFLNVTVICRESEGLFWKRVYQIFQIEDDGDDSER